MKTFNWVAANLPFIIAISILGGLLLLTTGAYLIYYFWNKKATIKVQENSVLLSEIKRINQNYKFQKIKTTPDYFDVPCKSKRQYDRYNPDKKFNEVVQRHYDKYQQIVDSIAFNRTSYQRYLNEIDSIVHTDDRAIARSCNLKYRTFYKKQKALAEQAKLREPTSDFKIVITVEYDTPAGRYHYSDSKKYDYSEIKRVLDLLDSRNINWETSSKAKSQTSPWDELEEIDD